jgi:hypothetical protein
LYYIREETICPTHSSSPGAHRKTEHSSRNPRLSGIQINRSCRTLDPIFAVSVGVAAAVVRINREEKEKGKSFEESKASLGRRAALAWKEVMGEEEKGAVKTSG